MLVREIMTEDVVTINEYMSLKDAAELLAEREISGAPVVNNDGKLVGMLTEQDILRAVGEAADGVHMVYPSLHTMGVFFEMSKGETEILNAFQEQAKTIVMDVMSKNLRTCSPDTPVNEVARVFVEEGINRVAVVDEEDHVVGIIARGDIIRSFCGPGDER